MTLSKFRIIQAYKEGFAALWQHPLFYTGWLVVSMLIEYTSFIGLSIAFHLISWNAVIQNLNDFVSFNFFGHVSVDGNLSLYACVMKYFPYSWINHALENISWTEYWNVIIYPNLISLILWIMVVLFIMITVYVGYIKTAFAVQEKKDISCMDMFRYAYLVPQVVAAFILAALMYMISMGIIGSVLLLACKYLLTQSVYAIFSLVVFVVLTICFWLYMMPKLFFQSFVVIQRHESPVEAIKTSWHMACGNAIIIILFTISGGVFYSLFKMFWLQRVWLFWYYQASVALYRKLAD